MSSHGVVVYCPFNHLLRRDEQIMEATKGYEYNLSRYSHELSITNRRVVLDLYGAGANKQSRLRPSIIPHTTRSPKQSRLTIEEEEIDLSLHHSLGNNLEQKVFVRPSDTYNFHQVTCFRRMALSMIIAWYSRSRKIDTGFALFNDKFNSLSLEDRWWWNSLHGF
ncbi:hypothetical protein IFM89_019359 [Coptis chinensis]|uniref:Uncharacterized protein n=1 Tax=Coptis chinensis TaxID=261450 RepID=A0A835IU34_9MAGN|nr:hypothetical protein IFM89_019359 [Coptis chinensis]